MAFTLCGQSGKSRIFEFIGRIITSQIWAGIMQLCKYEGGGREVCIVVFNNKHQRSF